MTRLPDAAWWNEVRFSVGEGTSGSPGFAMSREEMTELFKLARSMQDQIAEQFAEQRAMVDIQPPSNDPASHAYLGTPDRQQPSGARAAGDAYTSRLRAQADYLQRLIMKLSEALSAVESVDAQGADGMARVNPPTS